MSSVDDRHPDAAGQDEVDGKVGGEVTDEDGKPVTGEEFTDVGDLRAKDSPPDDATATAPVAGSSGPVETDWRELQGRFVDDPAAAVREAGAQVEKELSDLRARLETGSTEDLRTAFRRYRDLHSGLS